MCHIQAPFKCFNSVILYPFFNFKSIILTFLRIFFCLLQILMMEEEKMLTIFSFILTILGSINWLLIGLLQYDFVAGIFGYQASIFSRIIYIIVGASSIVLVYKLIKGKGSINVFSRRNKKDLAKNIQKMNSNSKDEQEQKVQTEYYDDSQSAKVPVYNVESSHENISSEQFHDNYYQNGKSNYANDNYDSRYENGHESLFDEHLNSHK